MIHHSERYHLQLPCVQRPTSSYNFQLPHGCHCHHGRHGHGGHVGHVGHGGRGEHGSYGGRGEHGGHGGYSGQERTTLSFKFDFPGKL